MSVFDCFRDLLVFGDDIGTVIKANMYDSGFCTVDGVTKEGKEFCLTLCFKNEEENKDA
jgi:hypothetical protein